MTENSTPTSFPLVLSITDLATRWQMSRQGIHRRMSVEKDFPKPIQKVSNGRILLFLESDITIYEEKKPWTKDKLFREGRQDWIYANVIAKS